MARLPVIHQTEATECGLACLAMLANYHGHDIDMGVLRERFSVSLMGATLDDLMVMGGQLDLSARALSLDMDDLVNLQTPCILHWDMNHFVVLKSVSTKHVIVHDPGLGARTLTHAELSKHFTGIALELSPAADFSAITAKTPMRLSMLWNRAIGLKRAIFHTLILSIILQIFVLTSPLYIQFVVDGVIARGENQLLWGLAIGFGALTLLASLTQAVRSWAILIYGHHLSLQMVGNIFRHLIRLPVSYFEKRHIGDIISRINSAQPIQSALTQDIVAVLIDGVMALFTLLVMYMFSPLLSAIVVGTTALMALITIILYPRQREAQEETIVAQAAENSHVIESLRAAMAIKLFGREAQRESAWKNLYTQYVKSSLRAGRFDIWQDVSQSALMGVQLVAVVYFGAKGILGQPATASTSNLSIGMLFAFLMYRQIFANSAVMLLQQLIEFRLLGLHLDRLSDIVQAQPEAQSQNGPSAHNVKGDITIENLCFRYSESEDWVLKDFNAHFPAGEMSVITGLSGGGKTTLLKLMLGLYIPSSGRILIDGVPLSQIDLASWRSQIGVVMQEDTLLSGSLLDNISFYHPSATLEDVRRAARAAFIDDDIMAMPMQYESLIGDMGSTLSGGQLQRVLLARALYQSPKVLFLDEGTANLDLKTEHLVVNAIESMNISRIIIAHRPEFIAKSTHLISV